MKVCAKDGEIERDSWGSCWNRFAILEMGIESVSQGTARAMSAR